MCLHRPPESHFVWDKPVFRLWIKLQAKCEAVAKCHDPTAATGLLGELRKAGNFVFPNIVLGPLFVCPSRAILRKMRQSCTRRVAGEL